LANKQKIETPFEKLWNTWDQSVKDRWIQRKEELEVGNVITCDAPGIFL
jgi:hypothetical protein